MKRASAIAGIGAGPSLEGWLAHLQHGVRESQLGTRGLGHLFLPLPKQHWVPCPYSRSLRIGRVRHPQLWNRISIPHRFSVDLTL